MRRMYGARVIALGLLVGGGCSGAGEADKAPEVAEEAIAEAASKPAESVESVESAAEVVGQAAAEAGIDPATAPTAKGEGRVEPTYPVGLDPLLDLVPADSMQFVVVRDPVVWIEEIRSAMTPAMKLWASTDSDPELESASARVTEGMAQLTGDDFDWDKGAVAVEVGSDWVFVYGTSKPDAIIDLLRPMRGPDEDPLEAVCQAVDAAPGYAACASTQTVLDRYAPGSAAAKHRARLGSLADDLDRANVVAPLDASPTSGAVAVVSLPDAFEITVQIPDAGKFESVVAPSAAPALGLMALGSGATWANLDMTFFAEQIAEAPFLIRNPLQTLTGEFYVGSAGDTDAMVMLAGVKDAAVMGGLVALAGTQISEIPKTLPNGTEIDAKMEDLTVDGQTFSALHAKFTPRGELEVAFEMLGVAPELWLFSAGEYAGVVLGDRKAVEYVAAYRPSVLSGASVATLPKAFVRDLDKRTVVGFSRMSFDAFASDRFVKFSKALETLDPASRGTVPDAEMLAMARSIWAPYSSSTAWLTEGDGVTLRGRVARFGRADTEQGRAEAAAIEAVAGGAEAAATYGALAERYPDSPRRQLYEVRAGSKSDPSVLSASVVGVAAAVAIPAFAAYADAAESADDARKAAEAEAAAAAAAAAAAEKSRAPK